MEFENSDFQLNDDLPFYHQSNKFVFHYRIYATHRYINVRFLTKLETRIDEGSTIFLHFHFNTIFSGKISLFLLGLLVKSDLRAFLGNFMLNLL